MGETGKRHRAARDNDGGNKNQRRRVDNDNQSREGLVLYRILCPDLVIGSVIGKGGHVINSIRQESRAKVKVVDPFPGAKDRVILVYCHVKEKEDVEVDDSYSNKGPLCPAQDALIKLHAAISRSIETLGDNDKKWKDKEQCKILAPGSQCANIIGKSGATIKKLRNETRAHIKVIAKDVSDPTHACAMDFDNFVQINGDPEAVKKALYSVSAIMYKFDPKEEIPLDTSIPEPPPSIIIPSDFPLYPSTGFYSGAGPVVPARSVPPVLGAHVPKFSDYADQGNTWPAYSSSLPDASVYSGNLQSEELNVDVLCPRDKIGRVIGRAGGTIKSIRQATGARIEVHDHKERGDNCLLKVISTESADDLKSMAVEAVLLLQEKINDDDALNVYIRLLVPSKVIGCLIGRGGSIINEIRKRSKANVHITKVEEPKHADSNDELVEVGGQPLHVRDALVQIVLRLRDDVLRDKDAGHNPSGTAEPVYHTGSVLSVSSSLPDVSSIPPMGYDRGREIGKELRSGYGYGSLTMQEDGYRSMPSYSPNNYGGSRLVSSSTLEIMIPGTAYVKVVGKSGGNLANIRQISGAIIEISDPNTSRGDRVALISGTSEQKRSAENLIQAFIMAT